MEDQVLKGLKSNCITATKICCKKIAIIEDRLLLRLLRRHHYHRNISLEWVDLAYNKQPLTKTINSTLSSLIK